PLHAPVWIHRQAEIEKKGYDFNEGAGVMESLLKEVPSVPGAYLFQLFTRKWPKLMEVNPYFASGRIAEAIPKLVEALGIDPECPLTCFQLGYCFRATGELEKSESFYLKALRMAPEAGWIYSNLGRTYQAMNDKPKAIEAFWRALDHLPGDHFVLEQLVGLGEIFVLQQTKGEGGFPGGFVRKADYEKKMSEAIEKEEQPKALANLAWRLVQDRLFDLACQCFEKIRGKEEAFPEILLGLGVANLEVGRFKEAERFLIEYLDGNPQSAAAHLNLFKAYLAQEERDLAWEEIQTAVRLEPDRLETLRQLYLLFRETNREEEGLEWMDQLAEENPKCFAPLLVKAQALATDGKWPQAQEALQATLKRAPNNEETLLYYSAELGKRGQFQEILELLNGVPEPLPLSLTINGALAYSQVGRLPEGKKLLEKFLQRPELSKLEEERIRVLLKEIEKA
ncbi:MAG TPA: tetratricopeptide repeat protein, partial [bacterium]